MQIDIRSATVSFGGVALFTGLTATIPTGAVTAIIGPSGSGKSTVLGVLAGLIELDAGYVKLVGAHEQLSPNPSLVSWVPQGSNALPSRTVLDNVLIGPLSAGVPLGKSLRMSISVLKQVGLLAHSRKPARFLSGGELQRLSFARALASVRPLVFADEPTSNLDLANARNIADLLVRVASDATIVVATHDPLLVEAAHHVIDLRKVGAVSEG